MKVLSGLRYYLVSLQQRQSPKRNLDLQIKISGEKHQPPCVQAEAGESNYVFKTSDMCRESIITSQDGSALQQKLPHSAFTSMQIRKTATVDSRCNSNPWPLPEDFLEIWPIRCHTSFWGILVTMLLEKKMHWQPRARPLSISMTLK